MINSELNINEILSPEALSRESIIQLKKQTYVSEDNYEKLNKMVKILRLSISKIEDDTPEAKKNTLILGICLWVLGRLDEAIEVLSESQSRKIACYFLGKCHQELRNYETAIDYFERSKRADTEEFDIQMDIADTQRMSGNLQDALKLIQKLSKEHDNEANLHYQWAHCLDDLGEYDDAMTHYNRALEINPTHPNTLFRLAYDYDLNGEDEKAIDYYEKFINEVPAYSNVIINLGLLYEDHNDYEKAISCFETVLRSDPNHEKARLFLNDAKAGIRMHYDEDRVRKQDKETEVLNIPISDFELSVRSKNCLERMNIKTLDDLTKVTETELLSYKNFGETSLGEIKNILSQKGLHLGQAVEEKSQVENFIDANVIGDKENVPETISELDLSKRCINAVKKIGIETVDDLLFKTEAELLGQEGIKQTYVDEIKDKLDKYGLKLQSGNDIS
ncbi:MAG: putative RNA polymerase alpha subunit [Candidatus Scalindua rubra]|uniref:Putative RNA polymerase alpha subunit n=1 Tax=Candidatus Scalindua rubra TaxID=1872076 RepID=A0A1E3X4E3_9BACT|nr:MAG: putative RNA polymerase alpha subunit [Candidatus Scalindua rubra]